jgi:hypothetical protein
MRGLKISVKQFGNGQRRSSFTFLTLRVAALVGGSNYLLCLLSGLINRECSKSSDLDPPQPTTNPDLRHENLAARWIDPNAEPTRAAAPNKVLVFARTSTVHDPFCELRHHPLA